MSHNGKSYPPKYLVHLKFNCVDLCISAKCLYYSESSRIPAKSHAEKKLLLAGYKTNTKYICVSLEMVNLFSLGIRIEKPL